MLRREITRIELKSDDKEEVDNSAVREADQAMIQARQLKSGTVRSCLTFMMRSSSV